MTDDAYAVYALAFKEELGRSLHVPALGLAVGELALPAIAERVPAIAEQQHVVSRVVKGGHQR